MRRLTAPSPVGPGAAPGARRGPGRPNAEPGRVRSRPGPAARSGRSGRGGRGSAGPGGGTGRSGSDDTPCRGAAQTGGGGGRGAGAERAGSGSPGGRRVAGPAARSGRAEGRCRVHVTVADRQRVFPLRAAPALGCGAGWGRSSGAGAGGSLWTRSKDPFCLRALRPRACGHRTPKATGAPGARTGEAGGRLADRGAACLREEDTGPAAAGPPAGAIAARRAAATPRVCRTFRGRSALRGGGRRRTRMQPVARAGPPPARRSVGGLRGGATGPSRAIPAQGGLHPAGPLGCGAQGRLRSAGRKGRGRREQAGTGERAGPSREASPAGRCHPGRALRQSRSSLRRACPRARSWASGLVPRSGTRKVPSCARS